MSDTLVQYVVDDRGVARVVLDDPATRNALTDALLDQLLARLEEARRDPAVRVVVLASTGTRVFSSGGDLKAFSSTRTPIDKYAGLDRFPRVFRLLRDLGKPVVCAADGDLLAGAFGLALACDMVVARAGVQMGCPEINVGVFPFMISALIYRSVPRAKANELMMTGRLMTAEQAQDLHVVNAVWPVEDFDAELDAWVGHIASRSPLLMRLGKEALAATQDLPLDGALAHLQGQLALALTTEDVVEGVTALREKRPPEWRGR
ncbi:enoyl-CoA hydratase/isomerase family protein [Geodermatophilaceae bacterium NBWT11]|nr:enoyl-CoA hydratase/isomerase family protein [Geodermatophilaceae bacterium NBWT11]